MTDALAHRGPDGEGSWQNGTGKVLLGHRRLSIIDLSEAGSQPLHYMQRYTLIHNGEVYNYIELRATLEKKGYQFRSQTDSEVIAAAFDCWRSACVEQFDGMFAFAVWDEKEQELFVARDRFGEKPLYYFYSGECLLFASEMKAIWAAGVKKRLNQRMLFNFLTIGYTDNPARPGETFYEDIFRLPAASTFTFNPGSKQPVPETYWELDPEYQDRNISESEALEHFTFLFRDAVRKRLRSDVAVGSSLSGGLDSSSVIALASEGKTGGYSPKAFTALFPGFEKDEGAWAALVAGQYGLEHHTVAVSVEGMIRDWEQVCGQQEEPFGSASIYAQYKVYELARSQGIKVLLDGQGADEILAGYSKYYKWYWQELFRNRKLTRSKELKAARALGVQERFDYRNRIAAYFPAFATVVMENRYLLRALRQEDLTPDFVQLQSKEAYYTTPDHFTLNGVLHFNTCIHGLEELLRYADRNAMAHGREVRLPFLSHELVEFVFSLPARFKIRHGWTKWLLRETMKDKLPEPITWRKDKVGFEPPQQQWMRDPRVQEMVREARKKMIGAGILKASVADKPVAALDSHAADNYDWRYLSAAAFL